MIWHPSEFRFWGEDGLSKCENFEDLGIIILECKQLVNDTRTGRRFDKKT